MSIKIKKVKLAKGRTLEVSLTEYIVVNEIPAQVEVLKKCDYLAHQDLIEAFDKLKPHVINICELGCTNEDVKVTGYTLADGKDGEGVVLIGSKNLSTGKVLNLCSPLTEFFGEEYMYGSELEDEIRNCTKEVEEYLNGKCAIKQTVIDFDGDDENAEINIGTSDEPKKRGRKKKVQMSISVSEEEAPRELEHAV